MEAISLETVVSKIRGRREQIVRQSLISLDDDELATYQIEITSDDSGRNSIPPRFSVCGNEEYLAEFHLVQVEDEKEPAAVHNKSMPEEKDEDAKDFMTKKDCVGVQSAVARFSPFRNRKQGKDLTPPSFDGVEMSVDSVARCSPFGKKKRTEDDVKFGSVHDGVVVAVAPVTPVAGFSQFRKKKQASESAMPAKRPSVSYFKASTEPEAQSTPPPPGENEHSAVKSSASVASAVSVSSFRSKSSARSGMICPKASPEAPTTSTPGKKRPDVLPAASGFSSFRKKKQASESAKPAKGPSVSYFGASTEPEASPPPGKNKHSAVKSSASVASAVSVSSFHSKRSARSGMIRRKASLEAATTSTPGKERPDVLPVTSLEPATESTSVRTKEAAKESIQLDTKSTPDRKNEDVKESIQPDAMSTPVRKKDAKESIRRDAKSTPNKTEKDASESFVVGEKIDVKSTSVKEDEDLVSIDLENVNTLIKKSKEDDDTKSTMASSGSDRSRTISLIATHKPRGANQNATEELSLFERYLENVLDKLAGSCNCIPPIPRKCIPRRCDASLEEEEELKLAVENILADKFQRSKQKAQERKAEKKADKKAETNVERKPERKEAEKKAEKKNKKKKSHRTFAPACAPAHAKQPPTVEWGVKPSEDESDFSSAVKGFTVGEFLQKRDSRLISLESNYEDAGEKEVDAPVEVEEPSSVEDAVLSVTPVRMNKRKKVVEQIPGKRGNEGHEDGPDDASSDFDSRSGSDSDSEYTTEVVQVEFDSSKLANTTDANKYLAREVLRRYAQMTGVSLNELIGEFVDESLASITLDTFPTER